MNQSLFKYICLLYLTDKICITVSLYINIFVFCMLTGEGDEFYVLAVGIIEYASKLICLVRAILHFIHVPLVMLQNSKSKNFTYTHAARVKHRITKKKCKIHFNLRRFIQVLPKQ
jgi:hypothetical protein